MCGSFLIFANALQCSATVLRWMQTLWPLYPYREESRSGQVQSSLMKRTNSVLLLRPLHPAITIRATQPKLLASAVPRFGASCGNMESGHETILSNPAGFFLGENPAGYLFFFLRLSDNNRNMVFLYYFRLVGHHQRLQPIRCVWGIEDIQSVGCIGAHVGGGGCH